MLKQEIICPSCDQQFIILSVNSEVGYCPFCGDTVDTDDSRGDLEMGDSDDE